MRGQWPGLGGVVEKIRGLWGACPKEKAALVGWLLFPPLAGYVAQGWMRVHGEPVTLTTHFHTHKSILSIPRFLEL